MSLAEVIWSRAGRLMRVASGMFMLIALLYVPQVQAAEGAHADNGTAVLEAFDLQQQQRVKQGSELSDNSKHLIMFALAVPLLILLLITAGLGIATGVFGKKLYIPHMVLAGLTVTLALAHVIAGLVWFYPF